MLWLNNRSRSDRKNVRTLRDGLRGDDEGTYIQLLDDGHLAQMEMTNCVLSALLRCHEGVVAPQIVLDKGWLRDNFAGSGFVR